MAFRDRRLTDLVHLQYAQIVGHKFDEFRETPTVEIRPFQPLERRGRASFSQVEGSSRVLYFVAF